MPTESARCNLGDAPPRRRQRAHGARPEAERVRFEVVGVEHRPGPADDGVGVDVWPVVEVVLLHQPVAQGRRWRRGRRRRTRRSCPSSPPAPRCAAPGRAPLGRPPPAGRRGCRSPGGSVPQRRSSRRARASRRRSSGSSGSARRPGSCRRPARRCPSRPGTPFRCRASRRRAPFPVPPNVNTPAASAGSYPDEPRHHGHDRRLGQHEAIRRIVGDQIRIVDGRQQRPDDAGNRRRRNDVGSASADAPK